MLKNNNNDNNLEYVILYGCNMIKNILRYTALLPMAAIVVACSSGSSNNSNSTTQNIYVPESIQLRTPVSSNTKLNTKPSNNASSLNSGIALASTSSSCIQLYQYPNGQYYSESINSSSVNWQTGTIQIGLTNTCSSPESFTATVTYNNPLFNGGAMPATGYSTTQSGPLYLTVSGSTTSGVMEINASTPTCTGSGCGYAQLQPESTQFVNAILGYSGVINSLTISGVSLSVQGASGESSPGTLNLTLDAAQAESGCTSSTACNLQVNVISPANVVVATASVNPYTSATSSYSISNLLPGQYSLAVVESSVPSSNFSYTYSPNATISVGSGSTSSGTVNFAYTPNTNTVSVNLNNSALPTGFSNNIVLGRILNSSGAVVQNLQFSESKPVASASSTALSNGTYTLQIQGLGNPLSGVYYAPIAESFTITESSTNLTPSYAAQMTSGLYTITANVESPISGQTVAFASDSDYYSYATTNLESGVYTFPSNDTVQATASTEAGYTAVVSPSPLVISSSLAGTTVTIIIKPSTNSYMAVGYIDGTAPGAFATIPCSAFAQYDMLIVGFSNCNASNVSCAADADSNLLSMFQTVSSCAKPGAILSLSVGGENGSSSFATTANMTTLAQSLVNDVAWLNSQITTATKITGIDLDIEVGSSSANITPLAQALHNAGMIVSIAPMASGTSAAISSTSPTNFILTGGGATNDYAPAVAAGYVNYINLQAYNSGPGAITIDGYSEADTNFQSSAAATMNSLVYTGSCGTSSGNYNNGYPVCIPNTTKILIGTVANAIAGGTYTMWNGEVQSAAGNAAVLQAYTSAVQAAKAYPYFGGVMVWSLGNDYDPTAWSDTWDPVGAFTNNIKSLGL